MLKILQQHYLATGDQRVIKVMTNYFRYQLKKLPEAPLQAPRGGAGGSWWARQRGGDNLMSVLWLYNITGEKWLLDLGDLIYKQTLPHTDYFLKGDVLKLQGSHWDTIYEDRAFHCVNLAQGIKSPLIRYQQDHDKRHLQAVSKAFLDIETIHGQPHGLYGGDEGLHGWELHRGSELCSAIEMMFSLEKMLEITGDIDFADRLEKVAFNALPTQCTDDYYARQYFQQANQVLVTDHARSFFDDNGYRIVYGLLQGYPCCTCNLHQGWPKFVQHLWMASADRGLAALVYGPSRVTAQVADGQQVTIIEKTNYPFEDTITFIIKSENPVNFPLHLRVPRWCRQAKIVINGKEYSRPDGGQVVVMKRSWKSGDQIQLTLPMTLRSSHWFERSAAIERGPLVYALRIEEHWSEVELSAPKGVPKDAMHRGYRECLPGSPWNFALMETTLNDLNNKVKIIDHGVQSENPWNLTNAPIELELQGVRLPEWTLYNHSAGPVPRSPVRMPNHGHLETIRLIPYGCSTLRIVAFPWVNDRR